MPEGPKQDDGQDSNPGDNGQPAAPPDDEPLGDAGKAALVNERKARREAERRLKELEPLAQKAKDLEDARKSEAERLTEQLAKAQAETAALAAERLRTDVALRKAPDGMTAAQALELAPRLTGATPEELEADAEKLFAMVATGAPPGPRPPVNNLKPGNAPSGAGSATLAQQIRDAEAKGDWHRAQELKATQLYELGRNST